MRERLQQALVEGEEGHAAPMLASLVVGAGIVGLGIGAASDTGWLTIAGGVVGGLGFVVHSVVRHLGIDWDVYGRLEELKK